MKYVFRIALLWCLFFSVCACRPAAEKADLLISGGMVFSSSDRSFEEKHVVVRGDRIVYVGTDLSGWSFADTISASGLVVVPGFIDPHTHAGSDLGDSSRNSNLNYLYQGVTTVFVGNDGRSAVDLQKQFELWESQGIGTNAASYIGHSTVRQQVMGMRDAHPTQDEMDNMKVLVERGMKAGALGLSSGLYYAPASYSNTEEVISLADVAAQYGGVYDVHMRDESSYNIGLLGAVRETIEIARRARLPGHIAHIKCLGVDVWGQSAEVIAMVDAAHAEGLKITADQYPYRASGTSIAGALIPRWVLADGNALEKMTDEKLMARIRDEIAENLRRRGGPSTLLFTAPSSKNELILGKTLEDVSKEWQTDPVSAAVRIFQNGGSSVASFNMNEEDISLFMQQPWVMTGSDGSHGHPRKFGSYPKKIREYVLEKQILSLADMVYRSATLPAETFGLPGRGEIAEGRFADIAIFNPEILRDRATFQAPYEYAHGMDYVLVNGQLAIDKGNYTGVLAGRALKKTKGD